MANRGDYMFKSLEEVGFEADIAYFIRSLPTFAVVTFRRDSIDQCIGTAYAGNLFVRAYDHSIDVGFNPLTRGITLSKFTKD